MRLICITLTSPEDNHYVRDRIKKKKKLFKTLESSSTKELKGHLVLVGNGSW